MLTRLLQWLVDDERLKPRSQRERHPIPQDMPPTDFEGLRLYCFHQQCALARLHDQVWYLSQPMWQRRVFAVLGFRAPIQKFYLPPEGDG